MGILTFFQSIFQPKRPTQSVVERGDFKNDLAFLEYLTQMEIINLQRNIKILEKKEKIGINSLFINSEMFESAVQVSVMNIMNKLSNNYKALMLLYFKNEEQLISHVVSLLYAYALQKVEEANKDKLNKKQLSDAFSLFNKKKKENVVKEDKGELSITPPEQGHIEIPEVL